MHAPSAECDLLFGLLAVQLHFLTAEQLTAALHARAVNKDRPLADVLREQAGLADDDLALLAALTEKHLKHHQGDARRSLADLDSLGALRRQLGQIADPELLSTLSAAGPAPAAAAPDQAAPAVPAGLTTEDALPPPPGTSAAPGMPPWAGPRFRVLRAHAKGGLGQVSVALDGELNREVALKEIQPQYADDPQSRARFLLEAEVTGRLEHPGVVPVYSLGKHADGRPFYAMRFIKGDSLRDAIDRFHREDTPGRDEGAQTLALRQLLGRFVDVCEAVAYAHSRGVLHRDLKPGNVMLGNYGETLVVDWGLAKPLGERPSAEGFAEQTLRPSGSGSGSAQTRGAVGTPAYMSPEQAAGRADLLSPASDVYSLGATLYALLTGKAPVDGWNLNDVLRRVQAGDFPAPRKIKPQVAPALEAVRLKAMALKPEDRYGSAKELAEEVEHWLAGEPVRAWPEPWRVRAGRWLTRHRTLVSSAVAALVVAALLLTGATVLLSTAYANERAAKGAAETAQADAQAQRDEARKQNKRADANFAKARQAVEDYLTKVTDHPRLQEHDFRDLRKELLTTAVPFLNDFVRQQADDPRLEAERGRAYLKLAVIRGEIGEVEQAVRDYEVVRDISARLAAAHPSVPDYRNAQAVSDSNRGLLLARLGKRTEAAAAYREAIRLQQALATAHPTVPDYQRLLAGSHNNLGLLLADQNKWQEARAAYDAALRIFGDLHAAHPGVSEYQAALATSQNNLGNLLTARGQRGEAAGAFRKALRLRQALAAAHPGGPAYQRELAYSQNSLGVLLADLNEPAEAEAACRDAVRLFQALAAAHPSVPAYRYDLATSQYNLGVVLAQFGKRGEAEEAYRAAIPVQQALAAAHAGVPDYRRGLALSYYHLGVLLADLDRPAEAEAAYRESVRLFTDLAKTHPGAPEYGLELARSRKSLDRLRAGEGAPGQLPLRRALSLARAGDHAQAAAAAEALVQGKTSNALYYGAARTLALCAAAAKDDAKLREQYAARAVALLAELHADGYFASAQNAARLKDDADLAPLRQRADFRKLLAEVEKAP